MPEDKREVKKETKEIKGEVEEISPQEKRIRAITRIYYSKPDVQKAIIDFARNREVVPRYFEGFGKRPDTLQYPSDVMGLVNRGATSFHASEEIWRDPLQLKTEMTQRDFNELREGWDLLIDIDSIYLDYSKIAARLIINLLESHGIKSYGIKFSGSKGLHIIVPSKSFPDMLEESEMKNMFPDWPRAIVSYIMFHIKKDYNRSLLNLGVDFKALTTRTKLSKEELLEITCPNCGERGEKQIMTYFKCERCGVNYQRPNLKVKRKLKCTDSLCSGFFNILEEKEFFYCPSCKLSSIDKNQTQDTGMWKSAKLTNSNYAEKFDEEFQAEKLGSLDLVLVSSRHLFRAPYSLHEKTSLASVVISKEDLENFDPKDADPFKVRIHPFYLESNKNESLSLLQRALAWSKEHEPSQDLKKSYTHKEDINFDLSGLTDDMFPAPIKKLLRGLSEGRKRGLFILLTFFKCLNLKPEDVNKRVREWNEKNDPPLKENYLKAQIDWHLRQQRKILPPNYSNQAFYKDLGLLDKEPTVKNPLSEVIRALNRKREVS